VLSLSKCAIALGAAAALVSCAAPLERTEDSAIDNVVMRNATMHGIPAQAVLILQNGETIYRRSSGRTASSGGYPVKEETVFPTFSVSKLFAGTLLLLLVEEGKVDLAAPASRYVAGLPVVWHAITVEQFLNHVSGVPEYFDPGNLEKPFPPFRSAVFEHLADRLLIDPPGESGVSMLYNVTGAIHTLFILVSLVGIWSQVQKIWLRKRDEATKSEPTAILSLNQFSVSFLAYFSFFVYGYSIRPFNHYIVWPRLIASLLVVVILYEIWRDRRSQLSAGVFSASLLVLLVGVFGLIWDERYTDNGKLISASLIVAITLLIAQGYAHQIMVIWRSGQTGAVSLRMSQFILMMDISTVAFAFAMGLSNGWPLLLLATVSGITKLTIMWLFRWEKISALAEARRRAWRPVAKQA
jgi:hypothetical protein